MNLTNYERETIINYNEGEPYASIYTHNAALRRRLDQLLKTRPDEIGVIRTCDNFTEYVVPKKWIKVSPPRRMTEEQKKAASDRLAAYKYQTKTSDVEDKINSTHIICSEKDDD